MLRDLQSKRLDAARRGDERFFDAVQNAALITGGEAYYRTVYCGARDSWSLRDRHMFQTLTSLLDFHGPGSKAVVWEHNSHVASFMLPLRAPRVPELRRELTDPRLERAIGVIYRPETKRASHYFHAVLPHPFDEYVWFDETRAVTALESHELEGLPETCPFGL